MTNMELDKLAEEQQHQFIQNVLKEQSNDISGHNIYVIHKLNRNNELIETKYGINRMSDYGLWKNFTSKLVAYNDNVKLWMANSNNDDNDNALYDRSFTKLTTSLDFVLPSATNDTGYSSQTSSGNVITTYDSIHQRLISRQKWHKFYWNYTLYNSSEPILELISASILAVTEGDTSCLLFYVSIYDEFMNSTYLTKSDGEKIIITAFVSTVMSVSLITDLLNPLQQADGLAKFLIASPHAIFGLGRNPVFGFNFMHSFLSDLGQYTPIKSKQVSISDGVLDGVNNGAWRLYRFPLFIDNNSRWNTAKSELEDVPTPDNSSDNYNWRCVDNTILNPSENDNPFSAVRSYEGTPHVFDMLFTNYEEFILEENPVMKGDSAKENNEITQNSGARYISHEVFTSSHDGGAGSQRSWGNISTSALIIVNKLERELQTVEMENMFIYQYNDPSLDELFSYAVDAKSGNTSASSAEANKFYQSSPRGYFPVVDLYDISIMQYNILTHNYDIPLSYQKNVKTGFRRAIIPSCFINMELNGIQRFINVYPNLCKDDNGIMKATCQKATKLYMAERYWDWSTYHQINDDGSIERTYQKYPYIVNVGYNESFFSNITYGKLLIEESTYDDTTNTNIPFKLTNCEDQVLIPSNQMKSLFEKAYKINRVINYYASNQNNNTANSCEAECYRDVDHQNDAIIYNMNPAYTRMIGDDTDWNDYNDPKYAWMVTGNYVFFLKQNQNGDMEYDTTSSQQLKVMNTIKTDTTAATNVWVNVDLSPIRYAYQHYFGAFSEITGDGSTEPYSHLKKFYIYKFDKSLSDTSAFTLQNSGINQNYWELDIDANPARTGIRFTDFQAGKWVVFNRYYDQTVQNENQLKTWCINLEEQYVHVLQETIIENGESVTSTIHTKLCAPIHNTNYCVYYLTDSETNVTTYYLYDMEQQSVEDTFTITSDGGCTVVCAITGFDSNVYIQLAKSDSTLRELYHYNIESRTVTHVYDEGNDIRLPISYRKTHTVGSPYYGTDEDISAYVYHDNCNKQTTNTNEFGEEWTNTKMFVHDETNCLINSSYMQHRMKQFKLFELPDGKKIFTFGTGACNADSSWMPYILSSEPENVRKFMFGDGDTCNRGQRMNSNLNVFDLAYINDGKQFVYYDQYVLRDTGNDTIYQYASNMNAFDARSNVSVNNFTKTFDFGLQFYETDNFKFYPFRDLAQIINNRRNSSPYYGKDVEYATKDWASTGKTPVKTTDLVSSRLLLCDHMISLQNYGAKDTSNQRYLNFGDGFTFQLISYPVYRMLPMKISGKTKTPNSIMHPVKIYPSSYNICVSNA